MQNNLKASWAKLIWSNSNIPRRSFILWLALHNRLPTRDRLSKWAVCETDVCVLCDCGSDEV